MSPCESCLLVPKTAFIRRALGAMVVMLYIITMFGAGAAILNTFWAVTPLAQLLTHSLPKQC